ncbi:MAG: pyridoxal phosphate-dependent aminotransferase [bacterium]|jgi:aspartate aminotransferase
MRLAERVQGISPSPTLAMNTRAQEMRKKGMDVLSFTVGEPDFDTPQAIAQAGMQAIEKGFTRYTSATGIVELRQAICKKLWRDSKLEYTPEQIVVTNGGKHALFNALQVLVDVGEEVIIPAPYWVSYTEMVKMAQGVPVVVDTKEENDFKLTAEELEAAITQRTKGLIINSPSNPTGSVYDEAELAALGEVILKHQLFVISDEVYEKLVYDGVKAASIATLSPELKESTIIVNAMSKTYAMTGWRIGYSAAPQAVSKAMGSFQSHATSNPNSIAQAASLAALEGDQGTVTQMVAEFERRRNYVVKALMEIPGVTCRVPVGAFYVFPNVSAYFGREYKGQVISGSLDLAELLLVEAQVALTPGIAFGNDNYVRLSYATSMERIEEGVKRIKDFLSQIE